MTEHYTSSFVRKGKSGKGWRKCLKYKEGEAWKTISKKAEATGKRAAQKEAEDWRREMNSQYEADMRSKPIVSSGRDVTVAEYVRAYIEMRANDATNSIEESTVLDYETSLKSIADPNGGIANMKLVDLGYDDVKDWESWMLTGDNSVSVTTVVKRHTLLKAALTQAVVDKRISHNPMEGLKRPRNKKRRKINALMPDSMAKVRYWINEAEPTAFTTAVALSYCIGMRRQECAALKWEDISFSGGFARVRHAIGRTKNGNQVKDVKNHEARFVPLTDPLRDALVRRLERMKADLSAVGSSDNVDNLYVCGDIDGSFGRMWAITKNWEALREFLKLEGIWSKKVVFHDLRHSFATYAINAKKVDVVTVARVLGHSDKSVTLNWYSEALPTALIEAAPNIANALDVGNLETPQYLLPGDY